MGILASLLWPGGYSRPPEQQPPAGSEALRDLDIEPVVQVLTGRDPRRENFVTRILEELCADPSVIAYRAEAFATLLEDRGLRDGLSQIQPQLASLMDDRRALFASEWTVGDIVQRLGELELYVDVALGLHRVLSEVGDSAAFLRLRESIDNLVNSEEFDALRRELPALRERLEGVRSVTIGVNLSDDLRPQSAAILSIDTERIEGRGGLLERLLGEEHGKRGVTRLRGGRRRRASPFFPPMTVNAFGYENDLVADLQRLLESVMAPIGEAVERYVRLQTRDFAQLEAELSFLLNGVTLVQRLQEAGLPTCRPDICPAAERVSRLEGAYSVSLALRMMVEARTAQGEPVGAIVTNDVTFDGSLGRVWILTGPNRGGKTTFVRTVGLAHLLFQAGLYVPAGAARLSPVDAIYTHFPARENASPGEGRLDDEAVRLAEIFRRATPRSLILLNEVLSGTSTVEALGLAYDAIRGLHLLGARAVYVTHLHELGTYVEEINASTGGDGLVGSLVAEVAGETEKGQPMRRRTFRIRPGPPLGLSYASEIAEQHGISYAQLMHLLQERGFLAQPQDDGDSVPNLTVAESG